MKKLIPLLFFLVPSAFATEGVTLRFDFYYGETKIADVTETLDLSEAGDTYTLRSYSAAVGLAKLLHGDVRIESQGLVDEAQGLLMTLYHEDRKGKKRRARHDLDSGTLHLSEGEKARTEESTGAVFDYLTAIYRSYFLQAATGGQLPVTNGWRFKDYDYVVTGEETVDTAMGSLNAVVLSRHSDRGDRKVWLAPSLGYLPVRLLVDEKGHVFHTIIKEAVLPSQP